MDNNEEVQRTVEFSGETPHYPMDGNSNCTAWCSWYTSRVFRNGQPGWDCRFVIKATKTNPYATYGQGSVQAGVKGHEVGSLENKYIEITANQVRTYYDQTVFVKAEAGADIGMIAYANIIIPGVVSKGMEFTINVKRNLWGVYFDANGGSGAPSMIKRHWGEIVYIPDTLPTRYGYAFKGWSKTRDSSVVNYKPGDPIGDDFDVTLYAVWGQNTIRTWSITYNANGGTGAPARQTANVGQSITITSSRPTRSGYTFLGWATWSSATYAEYQPGSRLQSDYDMTLYAVWRTSSSGGGGGSSPDNYTITYHGDSGSSNVPSPQSVKKDSYARISSQIPVKSGYIFDGWSDQGFEGTVNYQPDSVQWISSNLDLYTVWTRDETAQYTVTFDLQGGSGEFNPLKGKYGESWYLPASSPYKSGYTFKGWATSPNGNPEYQPDDIYTIYGNATLYAVWEEDKRMYLGYDRIRKIYIGNRQVTAAYLGTIKIW